MKKTQWTKEMDALLGTMSDMKVVDQLGISETTVLKRRQQLGIPAFNRNAGIKWTPRMEALLGKLQDLDVVDELGISICAVRLHRRKLGIPSWRKQNRVLPEGVPSWSAEAGRIYWARRKHLKAGLLNTLTWEQWGFACDWFDNRCAYCGAEVFLTQDHLIPVSKGGARTVLNIIPACGFCNSSKHAMQAHKWIYWKFGMVRGQQIVDRIVTYLTEVQE